MSYDPTEIKDVPCRCCWRFIPEDELLDGTCIDCFEDDEEDLINKIEEEVTSLIESYQKETGEHVNKDDVELLNLINQLKERLGL